MSNADEVALRYDEETLFGVTDSGPAPKMKNYRFTGESLGQDTATVLSEEISGDRQVVDVLRTDINAVGDINWELSYGNNDDFFVAALMADSTWSAEVVVDDGVAGTVTTSAGNLLTKSATWDITPTVGEYVRIAGFVNAENNGIFRVEAATTTTLTVAPNVLSVETTVSNIVIRQLGKAVNGKTLKSYSIEKEFTDLSGIFEVNRGMVIGGMAMTIAAKQLITGSFSYMGKGQTSPSPTATVGDGSPTAAPTNAIMNAVDHVSMFMENKVSAAIMAVNLTYVNGLRPRAEVANLGPTAIALGTAQLSGNIEMYLKDSALIDKYLAMTETSLGWSILQAGNGYAIDLPAIKFTNARRLAEGRNGDVIVRLDYSGKKQTTLANTLRLHKVAA